MRSDIRYQTATGSVPYDLSNTLLSWQYVDTAPTPTGSPGDELPAEEQLYPAMNYLSGGHQVSGVPEDFNGSRAISVRVVCRPDWVALNGNGRRTFAESGVGGPTLVDAYGWGFALRVTGASVELIAYHQDLSLVIQETVVATVGVGKAGQTFIYGFTREISQGSGFWRVSVNGVQVGSVTSAISIPFTVSQPVTLGARDNQGVRTEFYLGDLESVTIDSIATTQEQERHENATRSLVGTERSRMSALLPQWMDRSDGTVYHDWRIRSTADALADTDARMMAIDETSIANPYGTQLDRWVRSLGVQDKGETIAETQALINATMADRGGFTTLRLREICAELTGADVADVALYETDNQLILPTENTPDLPAAGPWAVYGFGTADLTTTGITLSSLAGRDLRWEPWYARALHCWVGMDHVNPTGLVTPETFRPFYGMGFRGELVAISGSLSTEWVGITMQGTFTTGSPVALATHIGVYGFGPAYTLAYRHSTKGTASGATLGAWTVLGTIEVGERLSVSWSDDKAGWIVVVEPTPGDPTTAVEYDLVGVSTFITTVGYSIVSEGVLSGSPSVTWTDAHIHYPRLQGSKKYYLISPLATSKDHDAHTTVFRVNDRPTVLGHVTYAPEQITDSTDAAMDFTPLAGLTVGPLALADGRQGAVQNTTRDPSHLWTFQEASGDIIDRGNRGRFAPSGASILYEQAAPDDNRFSVQISDDTSTDHLVLGDPALLEVGSLADQTVILVYKYDPSGGETDDIVLRQRSGLSSNEWRLHVSASVNWRLFVSNAGGGTTAAITVPVTVGAWDAVAFRLANTAGTTYSLDLATRASNSSTSVALGNLLTSMLPATLGDDSGLAPALLSYRWLYVSQGLESAGLTGATLQTICGRVFASL